MKMNLVLAASIAAAIFATAGVAAVTCPSLSAIQNATFEFGPNNADSDTPSVFSLNNGTGVVLVFSASNTLADNVNLLRSVTGSYTKNPIAYGSANYCVYKPGENVMLPDWNEYAGHFYPLVIAVENSSKHQMLSLVK